MRLFPAQWTPQDYKWKIKLPGGGHGSPVVWGQRVYLLSADPDTAGATLEAELNRAYDTYSFVDPVTGEEGGTACPDGSDPVLNENNEIIRCQQTPASEVYSSELATRFSPVPGHVTRSVCNGGSCRGRIGIAYHALKCPS